MGDGDDHLLLGDEVLGGVVGRLALDLGAPLVGEELALTSCSLLDDQLHEDLLGGEDLLQPDDELLHLGELVEDLLALEAGEALELHLEDRLRLSSEAEPRDQAVARGVAVLRGA